MFYGMKVPRERKFHPWTFRSGEWKCRGTKSLTFVLHWRRTFLLSYVWVALFSQFCTRIFNIRIIQYRLNVDLIQWCNCRQCVQMWQWVSPIWSDLVIRVIANKVHPSKSRVSGQCYWCGSVRRQIMAICMALRLNNTHQRAKTVRALENTQNKMGT